MTVGITITGPGVAELETLHTRLLLAATPGSPTSVIGVANQAMQETAFPIATAVRNAAINAPVKGVGSTGLRKRVAASVVVQVRRSPQRVIYEIRSDPALMPANEAHIPAMMDGLIPWHHPIWGHKSTGQNPMPFFRTVITRSRPQVVAAMEQVPVEVRRQIIGR